MSDIFISYSRKDTPVVNRICKGLDYQGISYFIDCQGIGGGMEFPERIAEAIMGCRFVLFVASENSYQSRFTSNEVVFAFNRKPAGSVIPYIIDNSSLPQEYAFMFANNNVYTHKKAPVETVLMKTLCDLLSKPFVKPAETVEKEENKPKKDYSCSVMTLIAIVGLTLSIWLGIRLHSILMGISILMSTVLIFFGCLDMMDSNAKFGSFRKISYALQMVLIVIGGVALPVCTWIGITTDSVMIGGGLLVVVETVAIFLYSVIGHFKTADKL